LNPGAHRDGYFMTRQHHRLREEVRTFAEAEIEPRVAGMEKSRKVEVDLARSIAARGWIGVTVDPQYGGMGLGHLAKTIVIEEMSRISGAMGAMVQASQRRSCTSVVSSRNAAGCRPSATADAYPRSP
jgi:acyl-CoA dehydrogenase